MAWVVDTSVLLDVRLNDPTFGVTSATCLTQYHSDGLILCPVTYIELAPAFRGEHPLQQAFLRQVGINWLEPWNWQDTQTAHKLWADHVTNKRAGHTAKRPVTDVFIEAFALRFQGLITRNPKHFTVVRTLVPRICEKNYVRADGFSSQNCQQNCQQTIPSG